MVDSPLSGFYSPQEGDLAKLQNAIWGTPGGSGTVDAQGGEITLKEHHHSASEIAHSLAHKVISLGQEVEKVGKMLHGARISQDPYGDGLDKIVKKYASDREPPIQKVQLPKELVAHYGGDASTIKFGSMTLDKDPGKAEEQLNRLKELAKESNPHLGDMEVYSVTQKNGQKIAVVVGTDEKFSAKAFNGVANALNHEKQLKTEHQEALDVMMGKQQAKTEPEKQTVVNHDKMAELAARFPSKASEPATHDVAEIKAPTLTPAQEKGPSVREVV